ncbi:MAG: hypothetical protein LBG47_09415 [Prevotellaceae bacterium]|nr:hypothetical protein [Prevotellaceae bacterium]
MQAFFRMLTGYRAVLPGRKYRHHQACETSTSAFGRIYSGAPCGGALTSAARGRLTPDYRVRKCRSKEIVW